MKSIALTQGKVALIDDEDYEKVNQFKWYCDNGYAVRHIPNYKRISMQRFIMDVPKNIGIDHINLNKLDNRKENLRTCSILQNQHNVPKMAGHSSSKYKGVHYIKCSSKRPARRKKCWRARIQVEYKDISLGEFKTEEEAGLAYNTAAIKYFGEFAWLNKVPE